MIVRWGSFNRMMTNGIITWGYRHRQVIFNGLSMTRVDQHHCISPTPGDYEPGISSSGGYHPPGVKTPGYKHGDSVRSPIMCC